jgi:hypothetical protein
VTGEFLSSWRDGPTRRAIVDFVARTCGADGSAAVPPEERVAVFDNDGTLWCEQPMPDVRIRTCWGPRAVPG